MEYLKLYSKFAIPLMIVAPANIISANIDKVMIQFFWTANDVAYYAASQRLLGFILFITVAIRSVLLPSASRYHSEKRIGDISRITLKAERYLFMVTLPPVVIILALPHEIIHILLSDDFLPAAPVLQIVALWALTRVVNVPYRVVILGMDRPGLMAKITLTRALGNITLNLLFIPSTFLGFRLFGLKAMGAALATLITQLAAFVAIRYVIWRMTGTVCSRRLIILLYAGACMALAVWWLNLLYPATRWYHLLTYTAAGFGLYLAILCLFREFSRKDLAFFINALHPLKMGSYIKKEVRKRGV
jgi:O-antigen/teichoic acid export membrane protein